ncbi:Zinc finger PHD-type [Penicillium cf. griseofulvum]|uniref:JmjC domain-containing histone demethylation protein 1 n=1 Tax=Penicillium cf. griseofulvum TaxID=2972120 RepID=A0A9W9T1A3_9EURO|nr:Zinc finger PHD-type [Penicillium cf. griseofulvum]KAJ5441196.1 Zinc finger PHD-type [Penicillium cf. griseofulvum]KAJ5449244.1 Zinc finger PHD-type [Penicillium cf. griseofulvum]
MMSAASFANPIGGRPPQYRTPSPPLRAVEPITPSTTTDFHSSWASRGPPRAASLDRDQRPSNHNRHVAVESGSHQRSGHGRSSSTIDTLATIALATSPTFASLPPNPPSPGLRSTIPLFPPDSAESERPAKRARSARHPSPYRPGPGMLTENPHPAGLESMTTDAELLLNLARPTNFHPSNHTKRVSIDETFHHYAGDAIRQARVGFSAVGPLGQGDVKMGHNSEDIPHSRMRSRSDGSAFIFRPSMRGIRPTTSSGTLPPIVWEDEQEAKAWHSPADTPHPTAYGIHPPADPQEPLSSQNSLPLPPKMEEEESDTNQASCGACHLVRIPVETEEQDEDTWISCDGCKRWFHIVCAGFKNDREVRTVDKFICRPCRSVYGQTTFVRKSSRARTAIDYAGLNQGLVKAATDSLEHHYLEPIRQGKIRFQPENFPRMKPELVTAEYFERGNGWTEPIVIPACWNSSEPVSSENPDFESLVQEASSQEMFDDLLENHPEQGTHIEETVDCGQDLLGMVIPRGLTVRAVAELYGPDERVEVIDVKSQQGEDKRWNMQKWADYYESNEQDKPVRNVISLEVSQSKLGRLIRRPKVVRDLDLQDAVWPEELKAIGEYPKVQFYCLMSVADCYTDFHIDFGGSSVYYHILKGKKTFFFIPPKDKHLKKYEEWCNSPAQDSIFLGNQTKECYRVDLSEGDTMLIPSGWIHAVWTPENSLVIGGNFLTRLNYGMQIKILNIEKETKVPKKFRYPFFQKIQWYTAQKYLEDDPIPQNVMEAFMQDENYRFHRQYPIYYEFGERANQEPPGSPHYNARFYSQAELEGLLELTKYLLRTALIAGGYTVDGVVSMDVRNAVRRSIPKITGDPVDMIRKFGIWVAWKRGNEKAPLWTRPGVIESNPKVSITDKKPAGRPSRRSERNVDNQRTYAERQAVQWPSEEAPATPNPPASSLAYSQSDGSATPAPFSIAPETSIKDTATPKPRAMQRTSGLGPKRVACDACRKRRIRCRHKDEPGDLVLNGQVAVNAFTPGSGVSTPSSLAQDAVSALNSLAAIASQTGFQNNGHLVDLERFESSARFQSAVMGSSTIAANRLIDVSPDGANGGKKGRSKACDDCRKSKRRCIHDEYGRIDPIKAQERSKPRANASAKRARPAEEDDMPATAKKAKQESTSPTTQPAVFFDHDGDELMAQGDLMDAYDHEPFSQIDSGKPLPEADEAAQNQTLYASPPPAFQAESVDAKGLNSVSVSSSKPTTSLVSPPTSLADEMDGVQEGDAVQSVEGEVSTALHTPNSSSRHSSRQPRHVDRFAPDASTARGPKPAARASSSTIGARRTTPVTASTRKPSSRPSSSHAKKSSPMYEKHFHRHAPTSLSPRQHKHTHHITGDEDADEESLRLIRELQEQEFGLRKRSTRV